MKVTQWPLDPVEVSNGLSIKADPPLGLSSSGMEDVSRKTYPPLRVLGSLWSCLGPPIQKESSPLEAVHVSEVRLTRLSQPHVSTFTPDPKSQFAATFRLSACRLSRVIYTWHELIVSINELMNII